MHIANDQTTHIAMACSVLRLYLPILRFCSARQKYIPYDSFQMCIVYVYPHSTCDIEFMVVWHVSFSAIRATSVFINKMNRSLQREKENKKKNYSLRRPMLFEDAARYLWDTRLSRITQTPQCWREKCFQPLFHVAIGFMLHTKCIYRVTQTTRSSSKKKKFMNYSVTRS